MSSKSVDEKSVHIEFETKEVFQVKDITIPYSLIFRKQESFIYSGEEKISFKKRHPLYKLILLNEFRD
jgi:hypothetical protein